MRNESDGADARGGKWAGRSSIGGVRRLRGVVCALAICAVGSGQTPVGKFRAAFGASNAPPEEVAARRLAAVEELGAVRDAETAKAVVGAYCALEKASEPLVRRRAELFLGRNSGPELQLRRNHLETLWEVQAALSDLIEAAEGEHAHAALKTATGHEAPFSLRRLVARRTAALHAADKGLRTSSPEDLCVALEAAEALGRGGAALLPLVLGALGHADASVRLRAVEAAEGLRAPETLAPLIAALGREERERVRSRLGEATGFLTGKALGASFDAWSQWLEAEGGPFLAGEIPLGVGARVVAAPPQIDGHYCGIPLSGESLLFVHNNARSMNQPAGESTRIEKSRAELSRALTALRPTQRFNILIFADRLWTFESGQVPATSDNVARAQQWLAAQPMELGKTGFEALERAFVLAGRPSGDRYYQPRIDAAFFISDGMPAVRDPNGRGRRRKAAAGSDDVEAIHAAVKRWNPLRRVTIHTVCLKGAPSLAVEFMRELALRNGGSSVRL